MKRTQFLNLLLQHMWKNIAIKDPITMANIIYFMIKQYPEIINKQGNYAVVLKTIKKVLSTSDYGWSMTSIHKCFVELYGLLKYTKKSV